MLAVQPLIQADHGLPARGVIHHADLLADDAALLGDVFLSEIRRKHKFQQDFQVFGKPVGAGEVIGGHGVAGEGVWACARARKLLQRVAVLVLEHFVLKEMRHARRGVVPLSLKGKGCVHRAEIGREDGEGFAEAFLGQIADAQAVFQRAGLHPLAKGGIGLGSTHAVAPFIK